MLKIEVKKVELEKDGKKMHYSNYSLYLDQGFPGEKRLAIRPTFKDNQGDYKLLDFLAGSADVIFIEVKKVEKDGKKYYNYYVVNTDQTIRVPIVPAFRQSFARDLNILYFLSV